MLRDKVEGRAFEPDDVWSRGSRPGQNKPLASHAEVCPSQFPHDPHIRACGGQMKRSVINSLRWPPFVRRISGHGMAWPLRACHGTRHSKNLSFLLFISKFHTQFAARKGLHFASHAIGGMGGGVGSGIGVQLCTLSNMAPLSSCVKCTWHRQ